MKDRQPWSVRGVACEARAKAARAAAHRHITIGEWVTQVLVAAADRDLATASDEPAASDAPGGSNLPATNSGTERELAQALAALVRHLQKSAPDVQVGDIVRRMERTEHALAGRMEQMAAGLYSVMQTMETRAMPVIDGGRSNGDRPIMLPDQSRLADAVERVADAEARRQDQMAAVADALTMLAAKVDSDRGNASALPEAGDETPEEPEAETGADDAAPPAANDTALRDGDASADDQTDDGGLGADSPGADGSEADEPDIDTSRDESGDGEDVEDEPDEDKADTGTPKSDTGSASDADETKKPSTPPPPSATRYAGIRDEHGNDFVAAIRARSARPPEFADGAEERRRGLLGRLFRRG